MFHPGVTGSCGSRTQKHTLSATPMVRHLCFTLCEPLCIAYTSVNCDGSTTNLKYMLFCFSGCTDDIVTSDHSPVFATFEVGVTSQFVSKKGTNILT